MRETSRNVERIIVDRNPKIKEIEIMTKAQMTEAQYLRMLSKVQNMVGAIVNQEMMDYVEIIPEKKEVDPNAQP